MTTNVVRPSFVEEEHLEYLDDLRESGVTNINGAPSYVEEDFPELSRQQARSTVVYWMATFTDRHPKGY